MSNFFDFFHYLLKYRIRLAIALSCALLAATLFGAALGMTRAAFKVVFKPETTLHYYIFKPETSLRHYISTLNNGKYGWLIPDRIANAIPNDYLTGVIIVILAMVILIIFSSILRVAHNYLSAVVCIKAGRDIRVDLFKNLVSIPLLTLHDQPVTERVSRVMRDTHQLMKGYTNLLGRSMGDLLTGIAALSAAIWMEPLVSIVAIVLAPILAAYYYRHGRLVRLAGRRVLQQWSSVLGSVVESLQGMRVIKVHHAERYEAKRFREVNKHYVRAEYPLRWRKSVASPSIQVIIMIGFTAIAIIAAYRIEMGKSEPSQVLGALTGLFFVASKFKPLTMVYSEVAEASAAGERLLEIFHMAPETNLEQQTVQLPRFQHSIVFKQITFQYPKSEEPALNGITLRIEKGQTVAFVGPNGCGKTTLLGLVPRLYDPTSGSITIDGNNLAEVTLASLRKQMAVVTQETVLFRGTIAENIAYGCENPDMDAVRAAAQHAYADEFIQKKPGGYESQVGDRGESLSGGERQRIAIARAILRDPAILILDEATSMIDAETESLITDALATFCKDRTSLVIAHRLSTVVDADCIVVMNAGGIVDQGTHTELIQKCLLYQQLCRTQLVSETGVTETNSKTTKQNADNQKLQLPLVSEVIEDNDLIEKELDPIDEINT